MERLIALGVLLIVAGVIVLTVGIMGSLLLKEPTQEQDGVRAGGIILIGPLPIVVGTDKSIVLMSIAGALLLLAALFVWRR
jgi:uncharacterized protein (TIGR00304 family)